MRVRSTRRILQFITVLPGCMIGSERPMMRRGSASCTANSFRRRTRLDDAPGICGACGTRVVPSGPAKSAAAFPVRFGRPNPFDNALQFVEPGSDEFKGEKVALELEKRLGRIFDGKEPAPDAFDPGWHAATKSLLPVFMLCRMLSSGTRSVYQGRTESSTTQAFGELLISVLSTATQ